MFDQSFEDERPQFKTSRTGEAVEGHDSGWAVGNKKDKSAALDGIEAQSLLSKVPVHCRQVTEMRCLQNRVPGISKWPAPLSLAHRVIVPLIVVTSVKQTNGR